METYIRLLLHFGCCNPLFILERWQLGFCTLRENKYGILCASILTQPSVWVMKGETCSSVTNAWGKILDQNLVDGHDVLTFINQLFKFALNRNNHNLREWIMPLELSLALLRLPLFILSFYIV